MLLLILLRSEDKLFFFRKTKKRFTNRKKCGILNESHRGVAQFGRALRSGRRGRKFESCHLDQLQKAELRKKLVIQPFFVTWGVLRKTGFFPKWQVKWQVGNGQLVLVVGIFRVGSVVQSRKKANGFVTANRSKSFAFYYFRSDRL